MGKIVTPSSGTGYPYPNTLTLEFSYSELSDHSGHRISWTVTATDGRSDYHQYLFNASAWAKVGSGAEWNLWSQPTASIYVSGGEQLASNSFEVQHIDSINVQLKVGGGYYYSTAYEEASTTFALPSVHSAPTNVSGVNQSILSGASEGTFRATINVGGWGTNASQGSWQVVSDRGSSASIYGSSTASNTFAWSSGDFRPSTSKQEGNIYTWYPRAVNNYGDMTTGAAVYLVTPTAPSITCNGSTTTPQLSVTGSCLYRGGTTNSKTSNNAQMSRWRLKYAILGNTNYTDWDTISSTSSSVTFPQPIPTSTFERGKNYSIRVTAMNAYGAYSYSDESVYCPSGINGRVTTDLTNSMTIASSYIYSGGIGSSTLKDKMAFYQVKWSTNQTTVDNYGGTETDPFTTNTTVTGLTPGTTYYYRVYGWNIYGLKQASTTLSYTTKNRFEPSLYTPTTSATGTGANITVTVKTTGGLTVNASTVKTLKLYGRPVNGTWTQLGETVTGLNLQAEQSYTFTDISTEDIAGDWEFRVWASNGEDVQFSPSVIVRAPYNLLLQRIASVSGSPIQFSFNASANPGSADICKWSLGYRQIGTTTFTYIDILSDNTTITISTHNHLDFSTGYEFVIQAYNRYGFRSGLTTPIPARTPNRFEWTYVSGTTQKAFTPYFKTTAQNSSIVDVYYIVKNSLGSVEIDQDLRDKRLRFITQMLNYRPENVASIQFENGKILAYALDGDVYKFGIWDNGTLEETFHNGYEWEATAYKIPDEDGYVVESIQSVKGLNSSSAFSTTSCEDIMIWETE